MTDSLTPDEDSEFLDVNSAAIELVRALAAGDPGWFDAIIANFGELGDLAPLTANLVHKVNEMGMRAMTIDGWRAHIDRPTPAAAFSAEIRDASARIDALIRDAIRGLLAPDLDLFRRTIDDNPLALRAMVAVLAGQLLELGAAVYRDDWPVALAGWRPTDVVPSS